MSGCKRQVCNQMEELVLGYRATNDSITDQAIKGVTKIE